MNQLTFLLRSDRPGDTITFVDALPRLCRGLLLEADLWGSRAVVVGCVVRFRAALPETTLARLLFWVREAGGWIVSMPGSSAALAAGPAAAGSRPGAHLAGADVVGIGLAPGQLGAAIRSMLGQAPSVAGEEPRGMALTIRIGAPELAGSFFDRQRASLFLARPLPPPVGDDIWLRLRLAGGEILTAESVVASLRSGGEDGPGSPAGFLLALVSPERRVLEALDAHAGSLSAGTSRRAPRYRLRAQARLTRPPEDASRSDASVACARISYLSAADLAQDYVESLSQGGAFVRTESPPPVGSRVELDFELPDGQCLAAGGVVVYVNERGVGLRFQLDPAGERAIGDAIQGLATRRRLALVVDDDLLARRMLSDVLAAHGFEVITAEDGLSGLQVIIDELLGLDLLVTDLRMPLVDGEELIRRIRSAGGEQDLAIVVVTAEVDEALKCRMEGMGVDAVASKGALEAVAEAAEEAIRRRRYLRHGAGGSAVQPHPPGPTCKSSELDRGAGDHVLRDESTPPALASAPAPPIPFFVWKPSFKLGIPVVDGEHQRFFELINALRGATASGAGQSRVREIFVELDALARTHFAHEEAFLSGVNYPALALQRKQHGHFLDRLAQFSMAPASVAALDALTHWLVEHILGTDRQYASWVAAHANAADQVATLRGPASA